MDFKYSISTLFAALIPCMVLVLAGSQAAVASDTLLVGQSISGSASLVSENGVFELGFFSPALGGTEHYLGVQYKNLVGRRPAVSWLGSRIPITSFLNASLYLHAGKLYLEELGSVLWTSDSSVVDGSATAVAVLLNSGNFVVRYEMNHSKVVWQSFDYPADALLPGAWLGLNMATGVNNISLTLYKPPYSCTLMIDQSRKLGFVLLVDGKDYLGTFPDWMVTYEEEGRLVRLGDPGNPNDIEYMRLHLGQVTLLKRVDNATITGWQPLWSYPSSCKISAFFCGPFGVCTSAGTCSCIDGFGPRDPTEWELGHFVSGCSKIAPSNCEDDSFIVLDNLQGLPDNPQDEKAETSQDCEATCLSKCYCVAYSYHSGCKIWYSALYNLTSANERPHTKIYMRVGSEIKKQQHIQLVILVIGPAVFVSLIVLVLIWVYNRSSSLARQAKVEGFLAVYSYAQLKRATRNFSDELGEGGFGSVFKGTIAGSPAVAVKKLKGLGHSEKQFRAEVQTLGMIQHTNLVRLLGFCAQGTRRLLVYEYMPNGSLNSHLFSETTGVLTWSLRYRIAIGIAKGLAYLHEDCRDCIIHCDIKPENILLDAEFCPKIADFGMAKLLGREFSAALTTLRGTIGYLAPEWVYGQAITHKADVYSFGAVLLEIISGRRTSGNMRARDQRYFPHYAAAKVREGDVMCLLDGRLEGDCNVKELDVTCRVACWCIQDDETHRPSMRQVVHMLEAVAEIELPPVPASFQYLMDGDDSGTHSAQGIIIKD